MWCAGMKYLLVIEGDPVQGYGAYFPDIANLFPLAPDVRKLTELAKAEVTYLVEDLQLEGKVVPQPLARTTAEIDLLVYMLGEGSGTVHTTWVDVQQPALVTEEQLVKFLLSHDFRAHVLHRGSHNVEFRHPDGRRLRVPDAHGRPVPSRLLRQLLKQAGFPFCTEDYRLNT